MEHQVRERFQHGMIDDDVDMMGLIIMRLKRITLPVPIVSEATCETIEGFIHISMVDYS